MTKKYMPTMEDAVAVITGTYTGPTAAGDPPGAGITPTGDINAHIGTIAGTPQGEHNGTTVHENAAGALAGGMLPSSPSSAVGR